MAVGLSLDRDFCMRVFSCVPLLCVYEDVLWEGACVHALYGYIGTLVGTELPVPAVFLLLCVWGGHGCPSPPHRSICYWPRDPQPRVSWRGLSSRLLLHSSGFRALETKGSVRNLEGEREGKRRLAVCGGRCWRNTARQRGGRRERGEGGARRGLHM